MLYKTINLPTDPTNNVGGRPKGSPTNYAKKYGMVKDYPFAVCTFDDDSFDVNESLDGALLQCNVNTNGELCPPSDPGSRPYFFFIRSASRDDDGSISVNIFSEFDRTLPAGFDAGEYHFEENIIDAIFSGPFSRNGVLLYPNFLTSAGPRGAPPGGRAASRRSGPRRCTRRRRTARRSRCEASTTRPTSRAAPRRACPS